MKIIYFGELIDYRVPCIVNDNDGHMRIDPYLIPTHHLVNPILNYNIILHDYCIYIDY